MKKIRQNRGFFRWIFLAAALLLVTGMVAGCRQEKQENICILYTNDVDCSYLDGIGYDGLSAYRKEMLEKSGYVTLLDLGDALRGDYTSSVTEGQFPTDIMEKVGYDFCTVGNHEFDFGVERLAELIDSSSVKYLACNITYTGSGNDPLKDRIHPYEIKQYGRTQVAFIGVTTPYAVTSSQPSFFMEDGRVVYDFCAGNQGKDLQEKVQGYVDEVREKGADYVILVTHLGDPVENGDDWFSSTNLVRNTQGVDCVLDGHADNPVPVRMVKNAKGQSVPISSAGAKLQGIGQLVITKEGIITPTVITGYSEKDADITAFIEEGLKASEARLSEKVGYSEVNLPTHGGDGAQMVRNRECALGNFCADVYRSAAGSDVAVFNGGAIRAGIRVGDLTYGDMVKIQPFSDTLCVVKITGSELLDVLEFSVRELKPEAAVDGKAVGENGGFLQVSGMKFTVDTGKKSPALADASGMYAGIGAGERRVSDVMIQGADGTYSPLDPEKVYTLASHTYILQNGGDGYTMFGDNEFAMQSGPGDVEIMIRYIRDQLGGTIRAADIPELGRITVK